MKSKNKSVSLIRLAVGVLLLPLVVTFTGCIFFAAGDTGIAIPNLTVKGAPSDITALSLRITGPGMAPLESYDSSVPLSITIEVPAGVDRQFELIAYIGSSSLSAATSFKGTATADLTAGKTTNITLNMIVNETKLVIPDYNNNRIVQIDDISGNGWLELIGSNIANIGWLDLDFKPYDVAFDSQGRIYIANNIGGSGMGRNCVVRVDGISGSGGLVFSEPEYDYGIVALTVDKKNNYVYYATSNYLVPNISRLFKSTLDGSGEVNLNITTGVDQIENIRGMAVDEDGLIYIAGIPSAGGHAVFKYDPVAENVIASYTTGIDTAWDVLVKPPYLYIANRYGADGYKIIQLNTDLGFIAAYGNQSPSADDIHGNFYGPKRFLAILNRKICLIDESMNNLPELFQGDRLASMDDITGTGWQTYGQTGIGTGQFNFYLSC